MTHFRPLALVFTGAALCATPATVSAHPHAWVTGQAAVHVAAGKIDRVGMRWQFDPFFSQVLTGDFDTDGDGSFNADETEAMQNQVFTSLKDYGYFTHVRQGEAMIDFDHVENFSTAVDKGELIFVFDLIPTAMVDTSAGAIEISVYDPTVYVDIILGGDKPVTIEGAPPDQCSWQFGSGDGISGQDGGFVTPQTVTLKCGA
ncbi:MAG: DUF1007 family protein [Rhodobacteraceae bacterium]|nr:DUF1007 family protein [Paracoccaceae bacterium]